MKASNLIPSDSEVLNYVPNLLLKKRSLEQVVEEALDYAHVSFFFVSNQNNFVFSVMD